MRHYLTHYTSANAALVFLLLFETSKHVAQAASASQVLGLHVCTTTPGFFVFIVMFGYHFFFSSSLPPVI
jgi:hypothetical protein